MAEQLIIQQETENFSLKSSVVKSESLSDQGHGLIAHLPVVWLHAGDNDSPYSPFLKVCSNQNLQKVENCFIYPCSKLTDNAETNKDFPWQTVK